MGIISALVFGTPLSFDSANVHNNSEFGISNSESLLYRMATITVNKKSVFEIESSPDGLMLDEESFAWDLVEIADGYFHILYNNKSYKAEVVKSDRPTKSFTFKINNHLHTVEVKDKFDLLLEKLGMSAAAGNKVNTIKAPMPGLIIDVKIQAGDAVKLNDPLLILEAMKMENVLKSPGEGIVKTVTVKKGDKVEKNQVLIEFQ
jgi:biotin carboxyl carrier protein